MGLGEELLAARLVTPEQLSEGVRAQVIYGGRLGTNLVELGHIDLDELAEALGQHHGLASALDHHFGAASERLQRELAPPLAAQLQAVPLHELTPEPRLVAVAFMDPPDADVLARVGDALGAEIVPVIAPELRLRYQLERVYGLPRSNRFIRVRRPSEPPSRPPAPGQERRRYLKTLSDVDQEQESGRLGRIELQQRVVVRGGAAEPDQIDEATELESAIAGMRRATDRDRVVELAVSCLRNGVGGALGAALFLLVRREVAIGWRGFSAEASDDLVQSVAIPLDEPSVLQLAYKAGVMVCGKPPASGERIDLRLWQLLGCSYLPAECVVVPVRVQDRIPCLLYAHARDYGAIPADVGNTVESLGEAAGTAFTRLIRAAER